MGVGLAFDLVDHVHTRAVAAALELGGEEGVNDIEREARACDALADREHVGVVVLADHAGRECL